MNTESKFLKAARDWICDGYSLDIRYVQRLDLGAPQLWEAWVTLQPLPPKQRLSFTVATPLIVAGQRQFPRLKASQILARIEEAILGRIKVDDTQLHILETDSAVVLLRGRASRNLVCAAQSTSERQSTHSSWNTRPEFVGHSA
jgi:hypothetical protein